MNRIENYYKIDRVSQSQIKSLIKGIGTYKREETNMFYEESTHLIIGSAVDCLLLTEELFDEQFYICDLNKKPSDKIMSIVRQAYSEYRLSEEFESNIEFEFYVQKACNEHSYYMNRSKSNYKEDTRVSDILKKGKDYLEEVKKAGKKYMLDEEEYELCKTIVDSIKNHEFTSKYFTEKNSFSQVIVLFEYKNIKCKALIDYLIIDHNAKTILPIDIKTTGDSTKSFLKSARRYRYDIQAAWYTLGLQLTDEIIINELQTINIKDYQVLPFKFIVESTTSPEICPLIYTMDEKSLLIAQHGGIKTNEGIEPYIYKDVEPDIYGFDHGIDLYKWHYENDQWEYDKKIYELRGEMDMNLWN